MRSFAAIAAAAVAAGTAAWWIFERPQPAPETIAPAALWAATFADASGQPQSLGQFRGRVLVANFWATWCAPCRDEMPLLAEAQSRWGSRGVQVIGLSADEPQAVARFGRQLGVSYPLLVGKSEVDEFARRVGDTLGVLPFTAVIDREGRVINTKVGAYSRRELDQTLEQALQEHRQTSPK